MYKLKPTKLLSFPVVCMCVKHDLTLRQEHKLTVFDNRMLRKLDPRGMKYKVGKNYITIKIMYIKWYYMP
jgi:hypothetical protein